MTRELLIRAGVNDHHVIGDLLLPGGDRLKLPNHRPLIHRVVIDAQAVALQPELIAAVSESGTPILIDPNTPFLQSEVAPDDKWARLPFGRVDAVAVSELTTEAFQKSLVHAVVDHQLECGASTIIVPYLYSPSPGSGEFQASLNLIRLTREYVKAAGAVLPLMAILSGQLQSFAPRANWDMGVRQWARTAAGAGIEAVGTALGPLGDGSDSYEKLVGAFALAELLQDLGFKVIAWRQGIYGPALVAAGADGYECGMGFREKTDFRQLMAAKKPREAAKDGGGGGPGIYLQPFGRSFAGRVADALLEDEGLKAKVICDHAGCCPSGVSSMRSDRRGHAVRARALLLSELDQMPSSEFRLLSVARMATGAMTLALQANRILSANFGQEARVPQIGTTNFDALGRLVTHLASRRPALRLV